MENNKNRNTGFEYTYAAPTESERKTAQEIRRRYQPVQKKETQLATLRRLDNKVRSVPMIWGLTLGVIGTLMFGAGMAVVLEKLLPYHVIFGVILSVLGLIPVALAYPVYCKQTKKYKEKYADEILKLSDEILNEQS